MQQWLLTLPLIPPQQASNCSSLRTIAHAAAAPFPRIMFATKSHHVSSNLEVSVSVRLKAEHGKSAVLRSSGNVNINADSSNARTSSCCSSSSTVVTCVATAPTEITVAICKCMLPRPTFHDSGTFSETATHRR